MPRLTGLLLFTGITLAQLRVSTLQIAALYDTSLERSAVEFAVDYINQQVVVSPLYLSSTLNTSEVADNETSRRDAVCDILSNADELIIPKLTQLSYEAVQDIIYNTNFPTVVAQNTLINVTALPDDFVIWRSTASELLGVIQSMVVRTCPAVVVLVESTENVPFSLSSVLPNTLVLSDDVTVDIIIVPYNNYTDHNLTSEIESAINSAGAMINASNAACSLDQFQSGVMLILNSPVYEAEAILTTVPEYNKYRWLLLSHLTSHLDDIITSSTNNESLKRFHTIVQGLQVDSLSTQEFIDFQNHWLSANKTMFPDSSFDNAEFAYDVYKAVVTLLDTVNMSDYNQTNFNCSSLYAMNITYALSSESISDDASILQRNYTIWNVTDTDFTKFGRWSSDAGFEKISDGCELSDTGGNTGSTDMQFQNNYAGVHFNIVTIQEIPFIMRDPNTGELEGFCIDLLERLKDMLNFTYTIYEVEDGKFGTQQDDSTWTGIIGDIVQERANLSVASLSINVDRIKAVDFTKPYIELGTLILLYKEPEVGFSLLRFTEPFSTGLLIVFVLSWPIVGTVAWIAARSSPYDRWALKKEKKVDALYGFSYSMWAQFGSMTLQGSEYHPLSPSGRIVVVVYWFVILVLISCYTAQLAASLTTESIARVLNSINDLTNQDYVKYGTVNDSEVEEFFVSSNITTYRSAYPTIRNNLLPSADAAVDQVCQSEGRFAFIWDSIVIDSFIAQAEKCGLCSTGSLFDRKGYGFAFPLNSSYTNDFTIAILKLRESQFLLTLRNKWIPMSESSTCEESSNLQYTVTDIGDAFVILAICLVVSFLVLIIEILWKYYKITQTLKGVIIKWNDQIWKSFKLSSTSNRTAPSSKHHQDNGLNNGEVLSAPIEDLDDNHLPTVTVTSMFVKHKQTTQESV